MNMKPDNLTNQPCIAVVIPCYNEAQTIAKVVQDFRTSLPIATVYVVDNNSSDDSAARAQAAGAVVLREKRQGKGFVVTAILAQVEADYYVMVDGDDTYPAERVSDLLAPLLAGEADMVVAQRLSDFGTGSFRPLHVFGNKLVRSIINLTFRAHLSDVMSGYRAFTRRVADNLPVVAIGFDVETEMTLQLLYMRYVIKEIPVSYRARPPGSHSKLRTFQDGIKVLFMILGIFKACKPMTFFGGLALVAVAAGAVPAASVLREYLLCGQVAHVGRLIISVGFFLMGFIMAAAGAIIHTVNYRFLEMTNVLAKQISRQKR